MTDQELMQRIRSLADELHDDPDIDHRHVYAIMYAISGLLGLGNIRDLSPLVREVVKSAVARHDERISRN